MVGLGRLERPTSPLSGVRSNHLSYRPRAPRESGSRATAQTPGGPEVLSEKRNEDGDHPARRGLTDPMCSKRSDKTGTDANL